MQSDIEAETVFLNSFFKCSPGCHQLEPRLLASLSSALQLSWTLLSFFDAMFSNAQVAHEHTCADSSSHQIGPERTCAALSSAQVDPARTCAVFSSLQVAPERAKVTPERLLSALVQCFHEKARVFLAQSAKARESLRPVPSL